MCDYFNISTFSYFPPLIGNVFFSYNAKLKPILNKDNLKGEKQMKGKCSAIRIR